MSEMFKFGRIMCKDYAPYKAERKCPVCGEYMFPKLMDSRETCENCKWVDDGFQTCNPDEDMCENHMSLNEAREAYSKGQRVH